MAFTSRLSGTGASLDKVPEQSAAFDTPGPDRAPADANSSSHPPPVTVAGLALWHPPAVILRTQVRERTLTLLKWAAESSCRPVAQI